MTSITPQRFSGETSSLLVDAADLSRNVTKILMEAAGCHVSTCADFEQAAGLFDDRASETDNTFDLIVIDSRTLEKHFAVLRAIRSTRKVMPITISIIPEARAVGIFDLFEAGSKVVVTHPYQPQQFINILRRCLTTSGIGDSGKRIAGGGANFVAILPSGTEATKSMWFYRKAFIFGCEPRSDAIGDQPFAAVGSGSAKGARVAKLQGSMKDGA